MSRPLGRLAQWSLRRRIGSLLAAVALILVALLSAAVVILLQVRHAQSRVVNDYFEAIDRSNSSLQVLVDAETAIRGYALTGDRSTLAPASALDDGRAVLNSPRTRALLHNDPDLVARLADVDADTERWVREWATPTRTTVSDGGIVDSADILRGKRLFDAIRADFTDYADALLKRRQQSFDALQLRTTLLFGTVVAAVLLTALLAAAMLVLLMRWVVRPLDTLGAETQVVRNGDLTHAVSVHGPPELAALADDIDAMRRGLVDQIEEVRLAGQEIEAARVLLESQADDLRRSNRDLEQFAYVASHDLQEPLRKVASFCQLLEKRYSGQLDERADQYIAFAVDGAKRMQQLISDLLAFSRVGRTPAGATAVELETCLALALRNLDAALEESGARVTHDPLPVVDGAAALLTQLLQNLLGNAVKFRRPGVPPEVHLRAVQTEEHWEFSCRDNGIGIEQQYAERVFVIFQRLHAKDEYEGTGIGLALCRKIVEFHGGTIWIEPARSDEQAAGTTIRWTLPMAHPPVPDAGHADDSGRDAQPAGSAGLARHEGASA